MSSSEPLTGRSMGEASAIASAGGPARVLVVDDEALFARAVSKRLARAGFESTVAGTLAEAQAALGRERPDLVLLDVRLPDGSGLDFLARMREGVHVDVPVMVLTAFGGLDDAVAAMKRNAVDYLTKPIDLEELLLKVDRALGQAEVTRRLAYSRERESHPSPVHARAELLGDSRAMAALRIQVERLSALAANSTGGPPPTVLILGETGTGKDVAARAVHAGGARANRPFVHVDCAALPKELIEAELFGHEKGAFTSAHAARTGLIEAAEDGMLFLDEVGELPIDVQSRLLAVLERRTVRRVGSTRERPVAAWFVAATNRDLDTMVQSGEFRSDLYFRLKVLRLDMPPLRERESDAILLARHYGALTARRYGLGEPHFEPAAERALLGYGWPGNVRELVNVIERAVLLSGGAPVSVATLALDPGAPERGASASAPEQPGERAAGRPRYADEPVLTADNLTLDEAEALLIRRALSRADGNVSQAARVLGVTRMALRYRMGKHGLDARGRNSDDATAEGTSVDDTDSASASCDDTDSASASCDDATSEGTS